MNKIYILPKSVDHYGFIRQIAAEKHNMDVSALKIEKGANGKPFFKNLHDFYFNISHSGDLLAIAISDHEVGIDIEKLRSPNLLITKRFCADEREYIAKQDSQNRLFEVWTKKEACLKFLGLGLKGGLDSFSVFNFSPLPVSHKFGEYYFSVCGFGEFEIITKV